MTQISNETTLGKFIENNLNETYESWLQMTPLDFFKKFWSLNIDKISPNNLSIFFDNLEENPDDLSFKYTSIKECLNNNKPIIPFFRSMEALDLWNCSLNTFIYNITNTTNNVPALFALIRGIFLNIPLPLSYYEFDNDHPEIVYFKLMRAIPTDQCCWFWDKYNRMVFQIENYIYFQKYTNNFACIMMGKIEEDFANSSFDTVCNTDEFEKLQQKVYNFHSKMFYPDEFYHTSQEEQFEKNCKLL
jgi:hypothetical protein